MRTAQARTETEVARVRNTDEEEEDETRKIKKEVRKFGFLGEGPTPRGVGSDPAECAGVGPERFFNRDVTEI